MRSARLLESRLERVCRNSFNAVSFRNRNSRCRTILLLGLLGILLSGCASSFVFKPTRDMLGTPADRGLVFEDVTLKAQDGVRLSGWWVPAPRPRAAVLFFHGNGGNISHHLDTLEIYNRLGLATFILDYRGYGKSGGAPTEEGTHRDARAAWFHLVRERGIPPGKILLVGRSLGGPIAARLAGENRPGGLVVESAFTALRDKAREVSPSIPDWYIGNHRYDTLEALGRVRCPLLVIHSREDEIIPFRHGQRIFEAGAGPKAFLEIRGSHNGGFLESRAVYEAALDRFVAEFLERAANAAP